MDKEIQNLKEKKLIAFSVNIEHKQNKAGE
jgi:hypothetical protein